MEKDAEMEADESATAGNDGGGGEKLEAKAARVEVVMSEEEDGNSGELEGIVGERSYEG